MLVPLLPSDGKVWEKGQVEENKLDGTRVGVDGMVMAKFVPDRRDRCSVGCHTLQTDNWLLYSLGRPDLHRKDSDRSLLHLSGPNPTPIHSYFLSHYSPNWKSTWSKTKEKRSILGFLKGAVCECESLGWKANSSELPNLDPRKRNWSQIHKQVVRTLAAAFSMWNLRTERILSANRVST